MKACTLSAKSKWELREAENPSGPAATWPREQAGGKPATDRAVQTQKRSSPAEGVLHKIEYTDFPAEGIELWFENSTIYLPSER